ncbi:hypothetical protein DFJ73DRAFT_811366 [Zopfochytrium polystomum]|nr:hypothetical protein DFJ73DRAFT_811366 [Zopfochytrium polystomum]
MRLPGVAAVSSFFRSFLLIQPLPPRLLGKQAHSLTFTRLPISAFRLFLALSLFLLPRFISFGVSVAREGRER